MKSVDNVLFLVCIVVGSASALAAGGAGGHEGIPFDKIGWQVANLGILVIGIFFFIKQALIEAFENRQKTYLLQIEKTKRALNDAESSLAGIKEKLTNLEAGEKKALENAQHEANILKAHIIRDAESAAEKIKKDAVLAISNETSKAIVSINNAILNRALATAKVGAAKNTQASPTREKVFVKELEQVKA